MYYRMKIIKFRSVLSPGSWIWRNRLRKKQRRSETKCCLRLDEHLVDAKPTVPEFNKDNIG